MDYDNAPIVDSQLANLMATALDQRSEPSKKKRKSRLWEHFTAPQTSDGEERARCKHCKESYVYPGSRKAMKLHNCAEKQKHGIAKMIIRTESPLHMVNDAGFASFLRTLKPNIEIPSLDTIEKVCIEIYHKEKQILKDDIQGLQGIGIAVSMCSSTQPTDGYVFITGQFVDEEWKVQRKILHVGRIMHDGNEASMLPSCGPAVEACVSEWNLAEKLVSITSEEPFSGVGAGSLCPLILMGCCLARTLSAMAQEALKAVEHIIKKIRVLVAKTALSDSEIHINNCGRWDATYKMLLAASKMEGFPFDSSDPAAPTAEEWTQLKSICTYLRPLFEAASLIGLSNSTTNIFYHEICSIQVKLRTAAVSEDHVINTYSNLMLDIFDNYWKHCFLILAIAVVLDPACKMELVEVSFDVIYGNTTKPNMKIVDEGIHKLFQEYVEPAQQPCSELDHYLKAPLELQPEGFDILEWWKQAGMTYPTLSRMAREILAVPISTVLPGQCVFDTVPRKMDQYRCSLRLETLQALMCATSWL